MSLRAKRSNLIEVEQSKVNYIGIKIASSFLLLAMTFISLTTPIFAESVPNNKYGIHLAQPHLEELEHTKELVNSGGGDWGYVTLIIQENDRNREKWQEIFDRLRELHLIPIIRLATSPQGEVWRRPETKDAQDWVNFLDSLNWVVKNRYIILFNEPNHGSEWGGEVDAKNYAEVAVAFSQKLKEKNPDFFIMLAGLDASAPSSLPVYEDEQLFLESLAPQIFSNFIDGLSSHSYPNPGFSGSPYDTGRKSIRGYEWELELLKSLGIEKDLPVFITETGWIRGDEQQVANNLKIAFEDVWGPDDRVWAVTPFVLDYQAEPFLNFSWRKFGSDDYYQQYFTVQSLNKVRGEPEQIEKGEMLVDLPGELITASSYHFHIKLKNNGQSIWEKDDGYSLRIDSPKDWNYIFSDLKKIEPGEETEADFYLKTNGYLGDKKLRISLYKNNKEIMGTNWSFNIQPLPQISFKVNLYPKLKSSGDDFEIQIFDSREGLIYKKSSLKVNNSEGILKEIQNVIPGRTYRLVILKPYYLPRQEIITFQKGDNQVHFKTMFPLDLNEDGKWNFSDFPALLKNPQLFGLFLP